MEHHPEKIKELPQSPGGLYAAPQAKPGLYYRICVNAKWRGPIFYRHNAWVKNFQSVIFLVSCMVKAGAPMAKGFDVAATDAIKGAQLKAHEKEDKNHAIVLKIIIPVFLGVLAIVFWDMYSNGYFRVRIENNIIMPFLLTCLFVPLTLLLFVLLKSRNQALFLHMRDQLESGKQLSEVMRKMDRLFPPYYVDLLKVGEESGRLNEVLDNILESVSVRETFRSQNMVALLITFQSTFLIAMIIAFITFKVTPVFLEIINEMAYELPSAIQVPLPFFMTLSKMETAFALLALVLPFLYIQVRTILGRRGWNSSVFANVGLCLPYFRRLTQYANQFRIAHATALYLEAGMPLHKALANCANFELNFLYKRSLLMVAQRVENGESLSTAFARHPFLYTPGFVAHLQMADYSGQLIFELKEFSLNAKRMVEGRAKVLYEMQQPIYTLFLAYVVGSFAIYMFSLLNAISESALMW